MIEYPYFRMMPTRKMLLYTVAFVVPAVLVLFGWLWIKGSSYEAADPDANAAAKTVIANFSDPRNQSFGGSGVEYGPLDGKPDVWSGKDNTRDVTDADRRDAAEIVHAICGGDFLHLQEVVDRYDGKPFALAKVADVVNFCLYLSGAEYELLPYRDSFTLRPAELSEGGRSLVVIAKKPPIVQKWSQNNDNSFSSERTAVISAGDLLRVFGREITENINSGAHRPKRD